MEAPKNLEPYFSHDPNLERTIPSADSISRRIWNPDVGPVYWKLQTDYPHIEGRKLEEKAAKKMFLQPSLLTELVIRQKRRSTSDAEIVINFFDSKAEPVFKDNPSYLAFAIVDPAKGTIKYIPEFAKILTSLTFQLFILFPTPI